MARQPDLTRVVDVAYLASEGYKQNQIATLLNLSQTEISRCWKWAEQESLIERRNPELKLSPEEKAALQEKFEYLSADISLQESYLRHRGGLPVRIFVVGMKLGRTKPSHEETGDMVARVAAQRLMKHAPRIEKLGIMWGDVCLRIQKRLQFFDPPHQGYDVYPLAGDLDTHSRAGEIPEISSTEIARGLIRWLGTEQSPKSLHPIPVRIAPAFREHRDVLVQYFASIPGFKEIYGRLTPQSSGGMQINYDGLLAQVDTVVTSIGPQRHEQIPVREEQEVVPLVLGEIAGRWIPKQARHLSPGSKLTAEDRRTLADCQSRVLTPPLTYYIDCVQRAEETGKPGVVLAARGRGRGLVLDEIIRSKGCSEVIIDYELARELSELSKR